MEWLISLIAGAIGGNGAAAMMKNISLGPIGNSLAGIFGGAAAQGVLGQLGAMTGNGMADAAIGGAAGGGLLLMIIRFIRKMMA